MAKGNHGDWISVVEAAKRLRITREAIYAAIKEGRLRARLRTVSRKLWRIDPAGLKEFEVSASHQKRGKRGARRRYGRTK